MRCTYIRMTSLFARHHIVSESSDYLSYKMNLTETYIYNSRYNGPLGVPHNSHRLALPFYTQILGQPLITDFPQLSPEDNCVGESKNMVSSIVLGGLFLIVTVYYYLAASKSKALPPGPRGLPILGNALQLWASGLPFEQLFMKWSRSYGTSPLQPE